MLDAMAAAELRGSGDEARTWERDGASCGRRRVARGRRAGRRGRLGAHALGNLQPPGARLRPAEPGPQPPGLGGRPRWRPAASAAGCEEDRLRRRAPGSLRPRRARRGRGKRENEQAGRRHGRLRLLRFLPGRRLRRWLAGAGTVARFACHRGRKAALYGRHVTGRLSSAGRPAGGRERPALVAGAPAGVPGSRGTRNRLLRFALRPGPRPGRGSAPRAVSHTRAHPAPAQLGAHTPPDTHSFQRVRFPLTKFHRNTSSQMLSRSPPHGRRPETAHCHSQPEIPFFLSLRPQAQTLRPLRMLSVKWIFF